MAARAGLVHARDHVVVVQMLADAFVVKIVSVDERGYGIQAIRPKSLVDLMMARPRSRRAPGCPPPRSPTTAQGAPEAASSDGAYGQLHAWPEEARLFRPPTTSGPQGSTHVAGSGLMTNEHREHYEHHEHQESPPRPDGRPGGRAQATAGASKPEELTHGNGDGERVGHTIRASSRTSAPSSPPTARRAWALPPCSEQGAGPRHSLDWREGRPLRRATVPPRWLHRAARARSVERQTRGCPAHGLAFAACGSERLNEQACCGCSHKLFSSLPAQHLPPAHNSPYLLY